jgi:hypothetical protein
MAKIIKIFILTIIPFFIFGLNAQNPGTGIRVPAYVENGDTISHIMLSTIYVFPELNFTSKKQEQFYWRTVRDVKRTLPYAKAISATLYEINEEMRNMSDRERKAHMKAKENNLFKRYEPELRKLTLNQGKLLIRLVDRECERTSFDLIKEYRGGVRAFFWQGFARIFGADLKSTYQRDDRDRIVERVIILVESGQL